MGFLLLQYEFQRANREVNLCNRKSVRINNQLTRATKRLEKMQAIFDKEKSTNESKWNNIKSNFSQHLSGMALKISQQYGGDSSGAAAALNGEFERMVIGGVRLSTMVRCDCSQATDAASIMTALNAAIGQANMVIAQLIDQAKSLDEAKIDQKSDNQLKPISDAESDIQAEKSLNDVLTTLWEERKENAKGKLPEAIKDSMSGFGLKG